MIKRTIEVSRDAAHLAVRHDQLLIERYARPEDPPDAKPFVASIPCEDIGLLAVDHPRTTYTHLALATLMEHGAAVLICGRDHMPAGMLLPFSSNTEVVWRVRDQIEVSKPTIKRLWRELVEAKVRAQAGNLAPDSPPRRLLENLAKQIEPGDSTNIEAQAAKAYWSAWLEGVPGASDFRRDADGADPLNAMLNYGYAVLRAAVARALVSAGLFPAIALHHSNRSNAFALADDVMEPVRPLIDRRVRELYAGGVVKMEQSTKAVLLQVLEETVAIEDQAGPLMVALHRTAASLVRCYSNPKASLLIPVRC